MRLQLFLVLLLLFSGCFSQSGGEEVNEYGATIKNLRDDTALGKYYFEDENITCYHYGSAFSCFEGHR